MSLSRLLQRIKLKMIISVKRKNHPQDDEVKSYEKTCIKICLKLISHDETEFMIAPMSGKKYLKNDPLGIFIVLYDNRVEITNHTYSYNVRLTGRDWERLMYIFDNETEKRRLNTENQISSQINNSLHDVLDRISNL
jgi:hypothetical protein